MGFFKKDLSKALTRAIRKKDLSHVQEILAHPRFETDMFLKKERRPLHVIAQNGFYEAVPLLIEAGIDINQPDNCGDTALWDAVLSFPKNGIETIEKLYHAGADLYKKGNDRLNPLAYANEKGHDVVVDFFRAQEKAKGKTDRELDVLQYYKDEVSIKLHEYAGQGNFEKLKTYLSHSLFEQKDINMTEGGFKYDKRQPLHRAIIAGSMPCVKALVEAGAHLDNTVQAPLVFAVEKGHMDIVQYLLRQDVDPRGSGYSSSGKYMNALEMAAEKDNTPILNLLQDNVEQLKKPKVVKKLPETVSLTADCGAYDLEEIYHFNLLERISILRDKETSEKTMMRESFAVVKNESRLQDAFNEHVKRGGKVPEQDVFPNRIVKSTPQALRKAKN